MLEVDVPPRRRPYPQGASASQFDSLRRLAPAVVDQPRLKAPAGHDYQRLERLALHLSIAYEPPFGKRRSLQENR